MLTNLVGQNPREEKWKTCTMSHLKIENSQNLEHDNKTFFTFSHVEFKSSQWNPFTYYQNTTLKYLAFNTSKKP